VLPKHLLKRVKILSFIQYLALQRLNKLSMIINSLNNKEISTLDLKDRWVMMKSILELIMEVRHLFHKEEKLTSKI
jgi:flagellar biosynthesis regulator FlbT